MKYPIRTLSIACALAAATLGASAQQAIKIGFLGTLSGPSGALGQDQYDAFMLGLEQSGGKFGGAPVEVIKEDDQLKPDLGVELAKKLIEKDKVQIITGVTFSNVMMAIHKPITDAGVFLIGSNAGPTPITGKGCSPMYFSTSWNNDSLHESMGAYARDNGYKRVYLMAPNYQAGKDALSGFKMQYNKEKPLDEIYTQINQPDYSAEIAQLQAAKPDAVYVFYPGGMGVNFVKQYQQAGLLGKLPLLSASTVDGSTLPALKDIAIGVITSSPYSPDLDNPQNKKFVADFTAKYKRSPSLYAAQSYDAAILLNSALTKTQGKLDREPLRAALKQADFKSVGGPFKFNTNQFPIRNFYRVDVAKDASGQAAFVTKGIVLKEHPDAYASQCALK